MIKLRKDAKYLNLKNITNLKKEELKKLIQNKNSKNTQTEFICKSCILEGQEWALKNVFDGLLNQSRSIVIENDMEIDTDSGEIIRPCVNICTKNAEYL